MDCVWLASWPRDWPFRRTNEDVGLSGKFVGGQWERGETGAGRQVAFFLLFGESATEQRRLEDGGAVCNLPARRMKYDGRPPGRANRNTGLSGLFSGGQ